MFCPQLQTFFQQAVFDLTLIVVQRKIRTFSVMIWIFQSKEEKDENFLGGDKKSKHRVYILKWAYSK